MKAYIVPDGELTRLEKQLLVQTNIILGKKNATVFMGGVTSVISHIREHAPVGVVEADDS